MTRKDRYEILVSRFRQLMPEVRTELEYSTPFELLVAVILSAQCTDKRVNLITPALFAAFPDAKALSEASAEDVFQLIRSCSYPNNKTKSLLGMARRLVDEFNGEVPSDMDALLSLPGVGRKTANVILAVIFGKAAMAVDTHVFRVSERMGLTSGCKTPLATEKMLMKYLSAEDVHDAHHWLILHGRYVCKARKPLCAECGFTDICRKYQTNSKQAAKTKKDL